MAKVIASQGTARLREGGGGKTGEGAKETVRKGGKNEEERREVRMKADEVSELEEEKQSKEEERVTEKRRRGKHERVRKGRTIESG